MTNNRQKDDGTVDYGLRIVERVPLVSEFHGENAGYMMAKQVLMGHTLGLAV